MRISARQLRKIIREEVARDTHLMRESVDDPVLRIAQAISTILQSMYPRVCRQLTSIDEDLSDVTESRNLSPVVSLAKKAESIIMQDTDAQDHIPVSDQSWRDLFTHIIRAKCVEMYPDDNLMANSMFALNYMMPFFYAANDPKKLRDMLIEKVKFTE